MGGSLSPLGGKKTFIPTPLVHTTDSVTVELILGGVDPRRGSTEPREGGTEPRGGGTELRLGGKELRVGGNELRGGGTGTMKCGNELRVGGSELRENGTELRVGSTEARQGGAGMTIKLQVDLGRGTEGSSEETETGDTETPGDTGT